MQHTITVELFGLTLYFPDIAQLNWLLLTYHILLLLINIGLYVYASKIVTAFNSEQNNRFQITLLRSVNALFIFFTILDALISVFTDKYDNYFSGLAYTLFIIYLSAFAFNILAFFIRRKFGRTKELDGKTVYLDTYNSRLLDILVVIVIIFLDIYLIIQAWGLTSLLETTGLLGLLVAFLALTNQIWAPDPYYCMVILSSDMLEDGDLVQINDDPNEYIIARVNFIYTILFNIQNNSRVIMRNSRLIEQRINNLSKKASIDGLRYTLTYKIGYPPVDSQSEDPKIRNRHKAFLANVKKMFEKAESAAKEDTSVKVNRNIPFVWQLTNTGDYALEFTLIYYLDTLPSTKLTRIIRSHIYGTRNVINRYVYEASVEYGLSLATPDLIEISQS